MHHTHHTHIPSSSFSIILVFSKRFVQSWMLSSQNQKFMWNIRTIHSPLPQCMFRLNLITTKHERNIQMDILNQRHTNDQNRNRNENNVCLTYAMHMVVDARQQLCLHLFCFSCFSLSSSVIAAVWIIHYSVESIFFPYVKSNSRKHQRQQQQ